MSTADSGGGEPVVSVVVISKDEPALAVTLDLVANEAKSVVPQLAAEVEIVVVDASSGRLHEVRDARPWVRWVDFVRPEGVRVSIPHQRNRGVREARGEIVVFTDCGCEPEPGWLAALLAPIVAGEERVTCGRAGATGAIDPYDRDGKRGGGDRGAVEYLTECATINLAFRKDVVDEVGGFDETFQYGSDTDFSWRAVAKGVKIRYVPAAVVRHDWGTRRRQIKRSYVYGKARARLYRKHLLGRGLESTRKRRLGEPDVVSVTFPLYLLGLPLAVRYRSYLLLLLVPLGVAGA